MIGTAVIGLGYIGGVHLDAIRRLPGVRLVAVASDSPVAPPAADVRVVSDFRELLADPAIRVVHNCTPNNVHREVTLAALAAGKHVLSEKPLGLDLAEAAELAAAARAASTLTGVNFCYRYYPAVHEAMLRARDGRLGRVHSVFGHYLQDWLHLDTDFSWRLDPAVGGPSNAVADIGSHWLDLAQFVVGEPVTEVFAQLGAVHQVRMRPVAATRTFEGAESTVARVPQRIDVEDHGYLMLRFGSGATGALTVHQAAAGHGCDIEIHVYGTAGGLAWRHDASSQLWLGHRDAPNQVLVEDPLRMGGPAAALATLPAGHPLGYHDAVHNLFRRFYGAVAETEAGASSTEAGSGSVPWPSFDDGLQAARLVDAALRSSRSSEWAPVATSIAVR